MPPADESAAPAPNPPLASGEDRRTTQPTLHTARLALVPLTDEHLELEVELDSDAEVMRYLTGRAPCLVPRSNGPISAGSPPRARCPGSASGPDSTAATSSAGGSCNRHMGQISRKSPARPTLASDCCAGTGAAATPPRARESLSGTASAASASTGSSPRPWRSTRRRGRRWPPWVSPSPAHSFPETRTTISCRAPNRARSSTKLFVAPGSSATAEPDRDSSASRRHPTSAWAATWIARMTVVTAPERLFGSRPGENKPWLV